MSEPYDLQPRMSKTRQGNQEKEPYDIDVKPGDSLDQENSIYPEVRASVPAHDDHVPASTFRAWFLAIVSTMIVNGANCLLELHNPPLGISAYVVILLVYPIGRFLAQVLPKREMKMFGWSFSLNPGPFNYKEHTVIAIMAIGTTSYNSGSTATDVWTAFVEYLNIPVSTGYKLMFLLTSQGLAFGISGIFQRLVVDPAYCVWPAALPTSAMIHGLHDGSFQNFHVPGWKMSRIKFFWIVMIAAGFYQFLPGFLFTGLTTFAWITWIMPNNVVVNQVFGATSGMDLLPLTLDWNQITAYAGNPLILPSWALANVAVAAVVVLWILAPALHFSNTWEGLYFPFSSSSVFDNTGATYDTSLVITSDYTLNSTAYHEYSPIFLSTTSVLSYGLGLGAVLSVLLHAFLYNRQEIWTGLKATFGRGDSTASTGLEKDDIHTESFTKMIKKYKRAPTWWYGIAFVVMFALSIAFAEGFDAGLPWWGVVLAVVLNLILVVPVGIMTALTNQGISTNVLSALIGGFIWPGHLTTVVLFKVFTYVPLGTGMVLLRDQKLGHYMVCNHLPMKIPPRVVFTAQALGIIFSWLAQSGVNIWALGNIEGICTGENVFLCPLARSFESSTVFWGLIGPQKLFASGAMYNSMLYFFIIGAFLPLVFYFLARKFPRWGWLNYVHVPLIMSSTAAIPPATAANYMPWAIIGLLFNFWIRRRWTGWWLKYNYVLAVALDAALGISTVIIFFALQYPGLDLDWWGSTIADNTADGLGTPVRTVGEGEIIGSSVWN